VSNFDHCFTSDRSWKHSALLRTSAPGADESSLMRGEDPFANFHYVSRVSERQGAPASAPAPQDGVADAHSHWLACCRRAACGVLSPWPLAARSSSPFGSPRWTAT
jgi:hypothetical protein